MIEIKKVCVIGGGLMGRQIGLASAIAGYDVALYDLSDKAREDVKNWAAEYLKGRVLKERLTKEQAEAAGARFHVADSLAEAAGDADLVIEAIVEIYKVKASLFRELDGIVRPDTIIATNSSFMVSSLFKECLRDPSRLLNCHFYNPALVMKFVEVVQGEHTDPKYAEALMTFCKKLGKTPIWMKKEISGFAANRIIAAIGNEARYLVENGYLTYEEVDIACEQGLNHPMGPFRLMDLTGIDLTYNLMKGGIERGEPKPDCFDLIESMVKQGRLGRKTGKGFYDYPAGGK